MFKTEQEVHEYAANLKPGTMFRYGPMVHRGKPQTMTWLTDIFGSNGKFLAAVHEGDNLVMLEIHEVRYHEHSIHDTVEYVGELICKVAAPHAACIGYGKLQIENIHVI